MKKNAGIPKSKREMDTLGPVEFGQRKFCYSHPISLLILPVSMHKMSGQLITVPGFPDTLLWVLLEGSVLPAYSAIHLVRLVVKLK